MYSTSQFFHYLRCIAIAFFILLNINYCYASPANSINTDVYVKINNSNARLKQLFELIEKQTSFVFTYDENDINLSREVKLPVGEQRLKDVLHSVEQQTELHFTEKANLILVNVKEKNQPSIAQKTINVTIKGIVHDADGQPLRNVTVTVKGTRTAVQTDADGSFSINVPEDGVLVFSNVGYKQLEINVKGRSVLDVN
ncbi:MAG TPA: carboxypeptidase-like regulatory domain-containing protein, partial [Flavisolibacter sp.]|nr:carboxypeptidase-like regulatory domain-containing protein [Flavisolibacter sp.]